MGLNVRKDETRKEGCGGKGCFRVWDFGFVKLLQSEPLTGSKSSLDGNPEAARRTKSKNKGLQIARTSKTPDPACYTKTPECLCDGAGLPATKLHAAGPEFFQCSPTAVPETQGPQKQTLNSGFLNIRTGNAPQPLL